MNDASIYCIAAYHPMCDKARCPCVCHVKLVGIPPETTTAMPPQLEWVYYRELGWPGPPEHEPPPRPRRVPFHRGFR